MILIRYVGGGLVDLVAAWRSPGTEAAHRASSRFLMHIVFLHPASVVGIVLIDLLGSRVPVVLAILGGQGVELLIALRDLGEGRL